MPETTITVDRDRRGGLYELDRNHLGGMAWRLDHLAGGRDAGGWL